MMGKIRYILMFLAILMHISWWIAAVAQQERCKTKSGGNIGKTFYLATMENVNMYETVILKIVTNTTGYVNIVAPGIGLNYTYTVTPDITEISLNHSVRSNKLGKSNNGIILMSTVDIAVFVLEGLQSGLSEGYTLIQVDNSSTSFVVQSYEPPVGYRSQFIIEATENFTNINISLRMAGQLSYNQVHYMDEYTLSVSLNRLQTFHLYHAHDLTGSIIESSRPIVVFSGSNCVTIPTTAVVCNMIRTQIIPVHHLDMSYIVPPIYPNSQYLIRIAAYYNQTKFQLNSSKNISKEVNVGRYFDTFLTTTPVTISSDKKVSVALFDTYNTANYTLGNPFMIAVPGIKQFSSSPIVFPTEMKINYKRPYTNYASLIIKKQFRDNIQYDGSLLSVIQEYTVPSPFDQYVVIVVKLKNQTVHTISSYNTSAPLGVFVYGTAIYVGYGFVAGLQFNNSVPAHQNHQRTKIEEPPWDGQQYLNCTAPTTTLTRVLTSPTTMRTVSTSDTTLSSASPDTQLNMRCFSCNNIEHLRYCDTLQYCQGHEVCFVSSHRSTDGETFYSAGCTRQDACISRSQRRSLVHDTCFKCCNSEFCNINGCNDDGFPSRDRRGPLCYDCDNYSHPLKCHHITLCGQNEQCSIEEYRWGGTELVYKMGCLATASCPHEADVAQLKRSSPQCRTCCSSDFCNVNCTHTQYTAAIIG